MKFQILLLENLLYSEEEGLKGKKINIRIIKNWFEYFIRKLETILRYDFETVKVWQTFLIESVLQLYKTQ